MTYARKTLVSLQDTPYYHVVARCVRWAWLWGQDEYAGKDYSHRKHWVLDRLRQLTEVFTIELCAYAVMSNHYHLVVHVDAKRAKALKREEVAERWGALFSLPPHVERWRRGEALPAEVELAEEQIERWRARLYDLSWFMKCLNEHLARQANAEDECAGRFWEGRFRSQALVDEAGLLTAMAYVDLNPIRAGHAETPETSEFTSIYERIRRTREQSSSNDIQLRAFESGAAGERSLPYALHDYLQLVDWTGRAVRADKRGAIDSQLPPIMKRLGLDAEGWCSTMLPGGNVFGRAIGRLDHLRLHAQALGQSWVRGLGRAQRMYAR